MMGLSTSLLVGGVLAVLGTAGLAGAGFLHYRAKQTAEDRLESALDDADDPVALAVPEMTLGPLDYYRAMRHLQTQKKAAKKGYVKWFRLGSTMQRPRWVKPDPSGSGRPKVTIDGKPYYFDRDAMLVDERTGAWVAVHIEGESDPINLADPAYPGIMADNMERIINLEAEDKPPGLFDNLTGMDTTTLMWLGIGLLFLVYAAFRYMGGA